MNIAETTDLVIQQGAHWIQPLGYTVDGAPASFAGYTARMQARLSIDSAVKVIDLQSAAAGVKGVSCSAQYVTPFLSDTDTLALGALIPDGSKLVYDIEVVAPDGTVSRPWHGTLTLIRAITH